MLNRIKAAPSLAASSSTPVHFVEPESSSDVAADWLRSTRTALDASLAERGITTTLGPWLVPGAINFATAASLSRLFRPYYRSFMVALRTDVGGLAQYDWEIIPSGLDLPQTRRSVFGPWINPAASPRNPMRQEQVASLAFLTSTTDTTRWRHAETQFSQLAALGVSWRIEPAPLEDCSGIDVLVADCNELRQGGAAFHNALITAWRAGIPAILIDGEPERADRSSALDYLSIRGPRELIDALAQLQSHPQLYEAMRQRAADHARELRDNVIAARWIKTLSDVIAPAAAPVLVARLQQPVRALSLQAGRWLIQQGLRAGHSLSRRDHRKHSGAPRPASTRS